jgi:hypothetical protein
MVVGDMMKHLKLFREGFGKDDYYVEISVNEIEPKRVTGMDPDDFDKLRGLVGNRNYNISSVSRTDRAMVNVMVHDYNHRLLEVVRKDCFMVRIGKGDAGYTNRELYIYNYDDEYYFVISQIWYNERGAMTPTPRFWKCDQWDGLMELIGDFLGVNPTII